MINLQIQTEAQGSSWDESQAKKTVKTSRSSVKKSSNSSSSNRSSSSNGSTDFPKSVSTPTFPKGTAGGGASSYSNSSGGGGGGYQNGGDTVDYYSGGGGSSYQGGGGGALTFADKKKIENASRPEYLSPSGRFLIEC